DLRSVLPIPVFILRSGMPPAGAVSPRTVRIIAPARREIGAKRRVDCAGQAGLSNLTTRTIARRHADLLRGSILILGGLTTWRLRRIRDRLRSIGCRRFISERRNWLGNVREVFLLRCRRQSCFRRGDRTGREDGLPIGSARRDLENAVLLV